MITKEELSKMTTIEKAAEYIYGSELDFCKLKNNIICGNSLEIMKKWEEKQ